MARQVRPSVPDSMKRDEQSIKLLVNYLRQPVTRNFVLSIPDGPKERDQLRNFIQALVHTRGDLEAVVKVAPALHGVWSQLFWHAAVVPTAVVPEEARISAFVINEAVQAYHAWMRASS